ncbi:SPOR domain-containing protein [Limnohabitans sp. Jir72]|uniref:SPOR domain-containing protein n=1 Tax=Limnohabitans sp. Jir72 TaxID=1977909 RepID=UPI000D3744ED|nr:SPOR domain-containing protein [Limnohabitans sp. Jir72]PUE34418.1 sporulation protein [Limnohabitans sp. Jir72]
MVKKSQHGGTFIGFIMGLVVGLASSLAVAIYVTKVPTPFSNKNQPRSSEQDSAESQKNKDWNPNNIFQPKAPAEGPATAVNDAPAKPVDAPVNKPTAETVKSEPAKVESRPTVTADPLGDLTKAKSGLTTAAPTPTGSDPFDYVIQVGAFRSTADADAQKAKLALMGMDAKVSERDQGGRTVYRVRLGPFADKTSAEKIRTRLETNSIENTLVRVQR